MSSLKDALSRVTRVARHMELLRRDTRTPSLSSSPVAGSSTVKRRRSPPRNRVPKENLERLRPHLRGFQKKRYQGFLEPLSMPQLKIYSENTAPYNVERAEANFASKKSSDRIDVFNNFLSERFVFNKMVDFLVELTPEYLKSAETVSNVESLASVLKEEHTEFSRNNYKNVPRYHFHELPSFPNPLTKESFQEYIYFLTHLKILYRNSSSLASGIVPDILLYTHHLDNDQFKPYRSVHTYNYLIKYFGYDKFQNSFARELLLVMARDGHQPDIETINQLLKICRIHTNRRSLVSTYKVIINYLTLAKRLDLRANLSTWNRVYDCIDNIFLKEILVNKIASINLPILNNMCIRILEDFARTTKSLSEVINFVESDLCRQHWRSNPRLAEKVVYHSIVNAQNSRELGNIWNGLISEVAIDGISMKNIINGVFANPNISNKVYFALCMYSKLEQRVTVPAEVYGKLIQMICVNHDNYDIAIVNSLVRSLIHTDAVKALDLPIEYTEYADDVKKGKEIDGEGKINEGKSSDDKVYNFPYTIPRTDIPEHYKIMKRLTKHHLIDLEAKCIYLQNQGKAISMPWDEIKQNEITQWTEQKQLMMNDPFWWNGDPSTISLLGLQESADPVPEKLVLTYRQLANTKMGISHDINLIHKLEAGFDNHLIDEMKTRRIHSPSVHSEA